ncbi:aldo/keto reductase family oxidoreductase [Kocuria sp.]|uniref:aldo/keto reductase n=1 Tax=Kocuria sp. TaxID=1871328 RepID=UPI0026E09A98|nr:aldo/keto reductase [Kocuria sp.]MDO5367105.1 aldo/keto reductase [Kocuria sp.]
MSFPLIFGCMALGGPWDRSEITSTQFDAAHTAVRAAHRAGFELFDHADIYAAGKSEAVFGRILAEDPELRRGIRLQTKCGIRLPGNTGPEGSPVHYRLDRDTIRASLEGSLQRLGVDSVERLILHRPDPLTTLGEAAQALDDLRSEGLINSVGLSNMTLRHVAAFQQVLSTPLTAVQIQMSLAHRDFVETQVLGNQSEGTEYNFPEGLLTHCVADEIEVQAWGAMANGIYSGRGAPEGDPTAEATSGVVTRLAERMNVSREAVVVGWLLRHPYAIRPVVGTTNPERIRACTQAPEAAAHMTHSDWYELWTAARGHALP